MLQTCRPYGLRKEDILCYKHAVGGFGLLFGMIFSCFDDCRNISETMI